MVLLSFTVTKDSGMALHHAVSQMVSIFERQLSTSNVEVNDGIKNFNLFNT